MATEEATLKTVGDKYRSFLYDEADQKIEWRHGGPPTYDDVNKLFEEGRTKVKIKINWISFISLLLSLFISYHILLLVLICRNGLKGHSKK
jgi:hypothetical protein